MTSFDLPMAALTIASLCLFVLGYRYLMGVVRYPYGDTCALFNFSASLSRLAVMEKNTVRLNPAAVRDEKNERFSDGQFFLHYNLFLHLLRLFPETHRLRWTQAFNFVLLLALFGTAFLFLKHQTGKLPAPPAAPTAIALLFASLCVSRTKLLLVGAIANSDLLNHLLFLITALLALDYGDTASPACAVAMGAATGLAFRNRNTDLIMLAAGVIFLFATAAPPIHFAAYLLPFALLNGDWLYVELFRPQHGYNHLTPFLNMLDLLHRSPPGPDGAGGRRFRVSARAVLRLLRFGNPYSPDSVWRTLGLLLPVLLLAIHTLTSQGLLTAPLIYPLVYLALYLLSALFLTNKFAVLQDDGTVAMRRSGYFGGRQLLTTNIPALLVAGCGFLSLPADTPPMVPVLILTALALSLLHQFQLLLTYHFARHIAVPELADFHYDPPPWERELGEFIRRLPQPAVILGSKLLYGAAHGHCVWTRGKRGIDLLRPTSDEELIGLIGHYGVTHIAVTPFSVLLGRDCSLSSGTPGKRLREHLERIETKSPNLMVYRVINDRPA